MPHPRRPWSAHAAAVALGLVVVLAAGTPAAAGGLATAPAHRAGPSAVAAPRRPPAATTGAQETSGPRPLIPTRGDTASGSVRRAPGTVMGASAGRTGTGSGSMHRSAKDQAGSRTTGAGLAVRPRRDPAAAGLLVETAVGIATGTSTSLATPAVGTTIGHTAALARASGDRRTGTAVGWEAAPAPAAHAPNRYADPSPQRRDP